VALETERSSLEAEYDLAPTIYAPTLSRYDNLYGGVAEALCGEQSSFKLTDKAQTLQAAPPIQWAGELRRRPALLRNQSDKKVEEGLNRIRRWMYTNRSTENSFSGKGADAMFRRRGAHAPPVVVSKPKRVLVAMVTAGILVGGAAASFADPPPPTNGGNGAGQSGQCTGPQADRPSSCQSQGGPGNQP
jgi:hypothetical protein